MSRTLFSVLLLISTNLASCENNVTVSTSKGKVIGLRFNPNPVTNAAYDAFLGIPYGLVQTRFQVAIERPPWTTPLLAHKDGPACPQPIPPFSEDCLFLNVFTPVNASLTPLRYPVMVYIHGSAFTDGSSNSHSYGPDFLVPQGVIMVIMNHRLGAAGFLSLGSSVAPGNQGLWDTLLALRWVQHEIVNFGGDPDRVTLFGHSSGAEITLFHYFTQTTSGLFKQAIAMAGSPLIMVSGTEAARRARLLAQAVGCNSTADDVHLISCLQQADINDIVKHQNIPLNGSSGWTFIHFPPVRDSVFAENPFFKDSLKNLMRQIQNIAKPLILGFTPDDGMAVFNFDVWKTTEEDLTNLIPNDIQARLSDQEKSAIVEKIRMKYFSDSIDRNKIWNLIRLFSDSVFIAPNIEVARNFPNQTYGYFMKYAGDWNTMPPFISRFKVTGVGHYAEGSYLFYSAQDLSPCKLNLPNLKIRDFMVEHWITFAKTGVPDATDHWKPLSNGRYLTIDSVVSMVDSSELEDQYYSFWADLQTFSEGLKVQDNL